VGSPASPSRAACGPPADGCPRGDWQVFGLAGPTGESPVTYWLSLPRPSGPVLDDSGRSRSPLRGSPGFTPGSLLARPRGVEPVAGDTISGVGTGCEHL